MLPFLHGRLRVLERLLERSGGVLRKFNDQDLDVHVAFGALLDEAAAAYRDLGRATAENRVLALKAECVAASHGTNPQTLEQVTSHRRAMQRGVVLRTLQVLTEQLRADVNADEAKLAEAAALLRPIVLAGAQKGIVPLPWPSPGDAAAVEALWRALGADAELRLATRQVAMQVSLPDVHLVLDDLLESAG